MLSHDGYERDIQKMINRFQKVAELKEKGEEIKDNIKKLTQKKSQSVEQAKNYYFPE